VLLAQQRARKARNTLIYVAVVGAVGIVGYGSWVGVNWYRRPLDVKMQEKQRKYLEEQRAARAERQQQQQEETKMEQHAETAPQITPVQQAETVPIVYENASTPISDTHDAPPVSSIVMESDDDVQPVVVPIIPVADEGNVFPEPTIFEHESSASFVNVDGFMLPSHSPGVVDILAVQEDVMHAPTFNPSIQLAPRLYYEGMSDDEDLEESDQYETSSTISAIGNMNAESSAAMNEVTKDIPSAVTTLPSREDINVPPAPTQRISLKTAIAVGSVYAFAVASAAHLYLSSKQ